MYDNKFTFTEEFIEHVEKDIYFRDVHLFLKRVKNVIRMKNVSQVRKNLFICLRDLTLQWYISKLSENIKNLLRYDNEVEYWEKELLKKFKESVSVVMISLVKEKYTTNDVRRRKEFREYADVILRVAKFADLISKINQILFIYNEIDVEFQRNLSMSKIDIKLNSFLTDLDDRKNVWWQLADRKRSDENFYEFSINNQSFYEYLKYDNIQSEYQKFKTDRSDSSRFSQYDESQRYDQIYDDNRSYQSRDYSSSYSADYQNLSDKINFNSSSALYSKISSPQNDINRIQRSFLNSNQISNDNEFSSRSDQIRNISLKNDSLAAESIRLNWTSRSTFSFRSNEFDRKNDEYKSKIYNAEMNESNLKQKYSHENEYEKKYSSENQNQDWDVSVNFVDYDDQSNELYYEKITMNSDEKYETFAKFVEIEVFCIKCKKIFSFKNKLHKHLKKDCKTMKSAKAVHEKFVQSIEKTDSKTFRSASMKSTDMTDSKIFISTNSIIMKFTTFTSNKNYELTFRKWNYAETLIKLRLDFDEDFVCLNTRTEASLTNKNFVLKRLSEAHIHLMTSSLIVKDIDANVHEIKEYVNFSIYLSSKNNPIKMTEIHREMHLMKNLKANMLIDNDILKPKKIIIDVQDKKTIIRNCQDLIIDVKIHQRESFVRRNVVAQFVNIILSESYAKIPYKMKDLLSNRDFLFKSSSAISIFIYAHVIDARTTEVIVRNEFAKAMKISRNFKLEIAQEIQYDDCFYASQKHHLVLQVSKKNHITKRLKIDRAIESLSKFSAEISKIRMSANQVDEKIEGKISFDVIAYED